MPRDRTDKQSGKSSGKSSKYAASDSAKYPTDWSKWERDDENRRYVSYRLLAPGIDQSLFLWSMSPIAKVFL